MRGLTATGVIVCVIALTLGTGTAAAADDLIGFIKDEPEASTTNGEAEIAGTASKPSARTSPPSSGGGPERSGGTATASENEPRWTPPPIIRGQGCGVTSDNWAAVECTGTNAPAAPPPPDAPAGTPGITIRDVASFQPELATLSSEPNGWSVRGLHANVLATGGSSTRTGELFGIPAEVRFTPVAYSFDFGDGSAPLSTATPGATWAALGLAEFDPTPTSHAYESAGTFTVTLLVDYAAEYRVGSADAFTPIPGTLAIPSAPITIVVADSAATALVDRNCTANPRGPGC